MNAMNLRQLEQVAEDYERLLVPALFGVWAEKMADAARLQPGQAVLDVACGTGTFARAAALRVGTDGAVAGVDINPAMLAVARRLSPRIEWHEGSAEALPYGDDAYDAVVSQFGLMLFQDPPAALRDMMRVLNGGGRPGCGRL